MTLDEIIDDYIREYREDARAEMRFFQIQRRPSDVINKAALCMLPSGKRHPPQRRVPRTVLEEVEGRLQGIGRKLSNAGDFGALHRLADGVRHRSPDRLSFQEITRACVSARRHEDWHACVEYRW